MAGNSCIDDATSAAAGQTPIVGVELASPRSCCKSKLLQGEVKEHDQEVEIIAGKEERLKAAQLQLPRPATTGSSGGRGDDDEVNIMGGRSAAAAAGGSGGLRAAASAAGSRLRLGPLELALPRYADCPQIAYVLQGKT
jgi:hypothetical protein